MAKTNENKQLKLLLFYWEHRESWCILDTRYTFLPQSSIQSNRIRKTPSSLTEKMLQNALNNNLFRPRHSSADDSTSDTELDVRHSLSSEQQQQEKIHCWLIFCKTHKLRWLTSRSIVVNYDVNGNLWTLWNSSDEMFSAKELPASICMTFSE